MDGLGSATLTAAGVASANRTSLGRQKDSIESVSLLPIVKDHCRLLECLKSGTIPRLLQARCAMPATVSQRAVSAPGCP
jgi:hypothetical protein